MELLYECSTFVCLDNTVFYSFCKAISPLRLSLIRSLHIHFRFHPLIYGGYGGGSPAYQTEQNSSVPWSWTTFATITTDVHLRLPNLRNLSFFLQGELLNHDAHVSVVWLLKKIKQELKCLESMTVRFPWPPDNPSWTMMDRWELKRICTFLERAGEDFRILLPNVPPAVSWDDGEWKEGTIYAGLHEPSDELDGKRYAICLLDDGRTGYETERIP